VNIAEAQIVLRCDVVGAHAKLIVPDNDMLHAF
jgi:hypothetical protein